MQDTPSQDLFSQVLDKHPLLKKAVTEYVATVPAEVRQKNLDAVQKFLSGELTWAEIKNIPKPLISQLARVAYDQFKMGDLKSAESLFKGLAVLDHNNWYYRAAIGAVYQKQKFYEQALGEFDIALELNPDEITCLVNRGQCHLQTGDADAALEDFKRVIALKPSADNPWLKRAQALQQAIAAKKK